MLMWRDEWITRRGEGREWLEFISAIHVLEL